MPESGNDTQNQNSESSKRIASQQLLQQLISFRSAALAGGPSFVIANSGNTISTSDIAKAQAILGTVYGGVGLLVILGSFFINLLTSEQACQEAIRRNLSGKRFVLAASCIFSLIGASLSYSQADVAGDGKNSYVIGFATLFFTLSGYLISSDASKAQQSQPNGQARRDSFVSAGFLSPDMATVRIRRMEEGQEQHEPTNEEESPHSHTAINSRALPRLQAVNFTNN